MDGVGSATCAGDSGGLSYIDSSPDKGTITLGADGGEVGDQMGEGGSCGYVSIGCMMGDGSALGGPPPRYA